MLCHMVCLYLVLSACMFVFCSCGAGALQVTDGLIECKTVLHLSSHAALEQTSMPSLASLARQLDLCAKPLLAGKLRRNLSQLAPVLAKDPDRKSAWLLTVPNGRKGVFVDPDGAVPKVR